MCQKCYEEVHEGFETLPGDIYPLLVATHGTVRCPDCNGIFRALPQGKCLVCRNHPKMATAA
jgi:hypothetical protein